MNPVRILLPALFFALWLGAVEVMHFRLAGPRRTFYLEAGKKIAMVRDDFYPPRARLLDANRTPLAWSERYFDLIWKEPAAPPNRLLREIADRSQIPLAPEQDLGGRNWILRRDLTPEELLQCAAILRQHPALAIHSRLERIAVNIPEVREKLGSTRLVNGELQGVSGWEKMYDAQLRGTPGQYEVMLDRRRQWIDSTWQLLKPAVPGKDVQLSIRLEDL